jgi:alkanesulfonate monooxygenase SsuD/methylene tetrahydromethanopterin reductase-like flavin-dependent oxidoreductase (luciferase family)
MLGIGVGSVEPEFSAVGADFVRRGTVTDEHVAAMRSLWYDEKPEYHGEFTRFRWCRRPSAPGAARNPDHHGWHDEAGAATLAELGHGWFGAYVTPEKLAECLERMRTIAAQVDRPLALGPLEITVIPGGRLNREWAEQFVELGVDRIVFWPSANMDSIERVLDEEPQNVAGL